MNDEPDWKAMGWHRPPITGAERKLLKDIVSAQRDYLLSLQRMVDSITTPKQRADSIAILEDRKKHFAGALERGETKCGFDRALAVVERHLETLRKAS